MMTIAENTPDNTGADDSTTTSSTVVYASKETISNAAVYLEYVLEIDDVRNLAEAHPRPDETGMDVMYGKPGNQPQIIWLAYEQYTTKFEMSLLYAKSDE